MADRFFKKPNGVIIKAIPTHDIESLKSRFKECDIKGDAIKKEKKASKPKAKKAGK